MTRKINQLPDANTGGGAHSADPQKNPSDQAMDLTESRERLGKSLGRKDEPPDLAVNQAQKAATKNVLAEQLFRDEEQSREGRFRKKLGKEVENIERQIKEVTERNLKTLEEINQIMRDLKNDFDSALKKYQADHPGLIDEYWVLRLSGILDQIPDKTEDEMKMIENINRLKPDYYKLWWRRSVPGL